MRLLLAYILIAFLASPAIAQSADLVQTGNIVGGAIQASGNFKRICRCGCRLSYDLTTTLLSFDKKYTDFNFDDPTISDPVKCQELNKNDIKCDGYLPPIGDNLPNISLQGRLFNCSIVAVPIQP